jgi:hypothetical protein
MVDTKLRHILWNDILFLKVYVVPSKLVHFTKKNSNNPHSFMLDSQKNIETNPLNRMKTSNVRLKKIQQIDNG